MKRKVRNIGIDMKPPKDICSSEKCPWHGHLKIRGRLFTGTVVSKTVNTVIVQWDYHHFVPKYERSERRKSKIVAHLPSCINVNIGDVVRVGECRPLSKTKRSVVLGKVE
jgi:small subunit ribosomal protein S17